MFRTRFSRDIVAEFLPPSRAGRKDKVIVLCDGMPSIPRKQPLMTFLAARGFWVIYPRYRGTWESGGEFLRFAPHEDVRRIIDELPKGMTELAFGKHFSFSPAEVFVIGGSFGGTTAILASLDPRVRKVIANCPVVDWGILAEEEKLETSNPSYAAYIRESFGNAYRLPGRNWQKLRTGRFFNPIRHIAEIIPSKLMIFHALDDPYIPYKGVRDFARRTGARLNTLRSGGHIRTEEIVQKHWKAIRKFLGSAA